MVASTSASPSAGHRRECSIAAEAAGNYVSIHLDNGCTKLMRATLSGLLAALFQHGFARVHRGWLVHPDRVQAVEPTGTGDYRLMMPNGLLVPMSRRYPAALAMLRERPSTRSIWSIIRSNALVGSDEEARENNDVELGP